MSKKPDVKLGRKLAHCLRHSPASHGITLQADGSAEISDILKAFKISSDELNTVVESDDKKRFVIKDSRIWAAQGHSIPVVVPMREYSDPAPLFHGTKQSFLESIRKDGLTPQSRIHVHLSLTRETAETVAARRTGDSVILEIDIVGFLKSGGKLFQSENGVILAEKIPAKFVKIP